MVRVIFAILMGALILAWPLAAAGCPHGQDPPTSVVLAGFCVTYNPPAGVEAGRCAAKEHRPNPQAG